MAEFDSNINIIANVEGQREIARLRREIEQLRNRLSGNVEGPSVSGLDQLAANVRRTADRVQAQTARIGQSISSIGASARSVGRSLTVGLTAPLAALGALSLRQAGNIEQLEVRLSGLTGSAENGAEALQDIIDFTAGTPFQLDGVGQASAQLLSFGVAQEDLLEQLRTIGDIAAGSGANLNDLAGIYGRVLTQGQLTGETLNQIGERGIPINRALAETLGVAENEIRDLVSQGRVGIPQLDAAFARLTTGSGVFAGQLLAQSMTFNGSLSTLLDNVNLFARDIGNALDVDFEITANINRLTEFIQELRQRFNELEPETRRLIFSVAGISAAIGPVLATVGSFAVAIGAVVRALAPLTGRLAGTIDLFRRVVTGGNGAENAIERLSTRFALLIRAVVSFAARAAVVLTFFTSLVQLEQRFGTISNVINTLFGLVSDLFNAFASLAGVFGEVNIIISSFTNFISDVSRNILNLTGIIINGLIVALSGIGQGFLAAARGATGLVNAVRALTGANPIGNEFLRSIDLANGRLQTLRNSAQETIRTLAGDIAAGGIAPPSTEITIEPPTRANRDRVGAETSAAITADLRDVPAKASVEIDLEQAQIDGFRTNVENALASAEAAALVARRNLSGQALQDQLAAIEQEQDAVLTALQASITTFLQGITNPQIRLAFEQQFDSINQTINETLSIDPQTLTGLQNQLNTLTQSIDLDSAIAGANFTGDALVAQVNNINAAAQGQLEALRDSFIQLAQSTSDPEVAGSATSAIESINQQIASIQPNLDATQVAFEMFAESAGQTIETNIADSFGDIILGTESIQDAFQNMVNNIISQLTRQALTAALSNLTAGLSGGGQAGGGIAEALGFSQGGIIQNFAKGGLAKLIKGYANGGRFQSLPQGLLRGPGSGTSDSILARVSNGEFIQRAAAVRGFGVDFMEAVNSLNPNSAFKILSERLGKNVDSFANGGFASGLSSFNQRLNNIKIPSFMDGGAVAGVPGGGGGSNAVNVSVNMNNNGNPVNATVTNQSFDGRTLVLDVLLEDIRSNGRVSKGLKNAFGLNRATI